MTGRVYQASGTGKYRYGFNGKEKDDEVSVDGGSYDFGARIYNSRLGRFLSIDPLQRKYPEQSPYASFNGNPIFFNDPTGKSGEVVIDKQAKTITVNSTLILYGNAANHDLAISTAKDIQDVWNAAAGTISIDGVEYSVRFAIVGKYIPGLTIAEVVSNTDIKNNYWRVEKSASYSESSEATNANTGIFKLSEILADGSTTEGHEYGHGIGIPHPISGDFRGKGQPDISLPKGSFVDGPYTRNPSLGASTNDEKNNMNPESRKVTQYNIDQLGLEKLNYNSDGKAELGKLSNEFVSERVKPTSVTPIGPRVADGSF